MVRKQEKPEPDPINRSAKPLKRRRPIRTFSKQGFSQVRGRTVRSRDGYIWIHEMTADDELTAKQLESLLKKNKKEPKIVKNGSVYEIFVRKE